MSLAAFLAMLPATVAPIAPAGPYSDSDHDGLLDRWETQGFRPIDPATMGCKPDHSDVIIVFRIRSGMTREKIQPTIDRLAKFYADLPYKNPDGTTGLHMIAVVPPPMPKETDSLGYDRLYDQAMPLEWRGLAHGIMVDDNPGGGGQANRPDWCGTGYHWMVMAHELGHQYGLPHEPMGATIGSPFHPSLMNYDYSYQLGGDGEKINYSTGKFAPMKMKETDLTETAPFSAEELAFLTNRPYFFKIKPIDSHHCSIDWNRNGIFGEKHVRADINDGYSVGYRNTVNIGKVAGASALVSMGKNLIVVSPVLTKPEDYANFAAASLSSATPGNIEARLIVDHKPAPPFAIMNNAIGDPSAISQSGVLSIAYEMPSGIRTLQYRFKGEKWEYFFDKTLPFSDVDPTLVATPNGPKLLTWNRASHVVGIQNPDGSNREVLTGIEPPFPIGATWNTKTHSLAVVFGAAQGDKTGHILITEWQTNGKTWTKSKETWVEGEKGGAATHSRPQVIFDASKDRGPNGGYNIYVKGGYPDPNQAGLNFLCRQIEDPSLGEGWRIRMMGNEWAFSRSVCAVTQYEGDIAYAIRWAGGDGDHNLSVSFNASGIENEYVTDFDEVSFIFEHGLHDSLQAVRNEQWPKPNK